MKQIIKQEAYMERIRLTVKQHRIAELSDAALLIAYKALAAQLDKMDGPVVHPVPRAGYKVMEMLEKYTGKTYLMTTDPNNADVIVDDIIDSGATFICYKHLGIPFYALVSKNEKYDEHAAIPFDPNTWAVIFKDEQQGVTENIKRILQFIGENPEREGLRDTPARVERSFAKLYGGYKEKPEDVLKTTFIEGACDEMVMLRDIEFYSTCEHHMLPFSGKIHIAYVPNKKVVGISKLARLVEVFARRLQIQERLVTQIADALVENLGAKGVMVVCEAQHFCMTARGVEKQDSIMVTSAIRGVFKNPAPRQEFLSLIGRGGGK